jgi:arabinofuranosyltransferase
MINAAFPKNPQKICLVLCFAIVLVTVFRSAWISDDFFITQRTIENFFEGRGLTWNPGERVQTYTHPLWMLVLAAFQSVTHEFYFTTLFLSLVITAAALFVAACRIASNSFSAIFILIALALSKAFIDFSTSGLENALAHLVLALFFCRYWGLDRSETGVRPVFFLFLFASLAVLTRPDAALIVSVPLAHALFRKTPLRTCLAACAGLSPLFLWGLFSLFYYGFPVPNTAYAKLNTSLPADALALQGLSYLLSSVEWDPLTPSLMLAGIFAALFSRQARFLAAGAGVLLYTAYVIKIGGDYMMGRFFSAPLFCACLILARCLAPPKVMAQGALIGLLIASGFLAPRPTLFTPAEYGRDMEFMVNDRNIVDERYRYFRSTGLLNNFDFRGEFRAYPLRLPNLAALRRGNYKAISWGTIGYGPYAAGPGIYFVDYFALSDPLLSKFPVKVSMWQIGHFRREIPEGYMESVVTGHNLIKDPAIAAYYEKLSLVTRGKLSDPDRLKEIWNLNTGKYDRLLR